MDRSRKRNRPTHGYGCIFQALSRWKGGEKEPIISDEVEWKGKGEQGNERKTLGWERKKDILLADIPRREYEQPPGLEGLYCTPPRASLQG